MVDDSLGKYGRKQKTLNFLWIAQTRYVNDLHRQINSGIGIRKDLRSSSVEGVQNMTSRTDHADLTQHHSQQRMEKLVEVIIIHRT